MLQGHSEVKHNMQFLDVCGCYEQQNAVPWIFYQEHDIHFTRLQKVYN